MKGRQEMWETNWETIHLDTNHEIGEFSADNVDDFIKSLRNGRFREVLFQFAVFDQYGSNELTDHLQERLDTINGEKFLEGLVSTSDKINNILENLQTIADRDFRDSQWVTQTKEELEFFLDIVGKGEEQVAENLQKHRKDLSHIVNNFNYIRTLSFEEAVRRVGYIRARFVDKYNLTLLRGDIEKRFFAKLKKAFLEQYQEIINDLDDNQELREILSSVLNRLESIVNSGSIKTRTVSGDNAVETQKRPTFRVERLPKAVVNLVIALIITLTGAVGVSANSDENKSNGDKQDELDPLTLKDLLAQQSIREESILREIVAFMSEQVDYLLQQAVEESLDILDSTMDDATAGFIERGCEINEQFREIVFNMDTINGSEILRRVVEELGLDVCEEIAKEAQLTPEEIHQLFNENLLIDKVRETGQGERTNNNEAPVIEVNENAITIDGEVYGTGDKGANVRIGPGLNYDIVYYVNNGKPVRILGKDASGEWYKVLVENQTLAQIDPPALATQVVWIHQSLIKITEENAGEIPVIDENEQNGFSHASDDENHDGTINGRIAAGLDKEVLVKLKDGDLVFIEGRIDFGPQGSPDGLEWYLIRVEGVEGIPGGVIRIVVAGGDGAETLLYSELVNELDNSSIQTITADAVEAMNLGNQDLGDLVVKPSENLEPAADEGNGGTGTEGAESAQPETEEEENGSGGEFVINLENPEIARAFETLPDPLKEFAEKGIIQYNFERHGFVNEDGEVWRYGMYVPEDEDSFIESGWLQEVDRVSITVERNGVQYPITMVLEQNVEETQNRSAFGAKPFGELEWGPEFETDLKSWVENLNNEQFARWVNPDGSERVFFVDVVAELEDGDNTKIVEETSGVPYTDTALQVINLGEYSRFKIYSDTSYSMIGGLAGPIGIAIRAQTEGYSSEYAINENKRLDVRKAYAELFHTRNENLEMIAGPVQEKS